MNPIKMIVPMVAMACAAHAAPLVVGLADACSPTGKPLPAGYTEAFKSLGAQPQLLAWTNDTAAIERAVAKIDLLMLCGGEDVDPVRYKEPHHPKLGTLNVKRDEFEWKVLAAAVRQHKPVFGICRGAQVINVFFGGTLWQDLPTQFSKHEVLHRRSDASNVPVHDLKPTTHGFLYNLFGTVTQYVNSSHHQAVKDLAPGFEICAYSIDGVIEAIGNDAIHVHGVQFHPERLYDRYEPWKRLFQWVLEDAAASKTQTAGEK